MLVTWLAVAQAQDLTLSFPQLRPGQQVTFTIGGLNQGESATLVRANAVGPGLCPAALGGVCLDITGSPAIVASAVANASGVARITLTVPGNVPNGLGAALQAVAVRGVGGVDSVKSRGIGTTVTTGAICPAYADPTVLPGGDGSAGQPYPSIGYAMAFRDPTCTDVLLYPGTYDENIDYAGADLSISSIEGRDSTILSSSVGGTLVRLVNGETEAAMLQ
ncbi:MAG: hypothetical protein KC621_32890, partial [Myxococcales bacterium]|nr:hypothetical protein [Myxococcales bacterium]